MNDILDQLNNNRELNKDKILNLKFTFFSFTIREARKTVVKKK